MKYILKYVARLSPFASSFWTKTFAICALAMVAIAVQPSGSSNAAGAASNPMAAASRDEASPVWRGARYGGVNCMLLLYYLHGNTAEYPACIRSLRDAPRPNTVADLLKAAKRLDFPLEARSISPEELDAVRLPVIVHLDGESPGDGIFCVLLGRSRSRVCYMQGPDAVVLSTNKELFLRSWSGVIMYANPQRGPVAPLLIGFFLAAPLSLLRRVRPMSLRRHLPVSVHIHPKSNGR